MGCLPLFIELLVIILKRAGEIDNPDIMQLCIFLNQYILSFWFYSLTTLRSKQSPQPSHVLLQLLDVDDLTKDPVLLVIPSHGRWNFIQVLCTVVPLQQSSPIGILCVHDWLAILVWIGSIWQVLINAGCWDWPGSFHCLHVSFAVVKSIFLDG